MYYFAYNYSDNVLDESPEWQIMSGGRVQLAMHLALLLVDSNTWRETKEQDAQRIKAVIDAVDEGDVVSVRYMSFYKE